MQRDRLSSLQLRRYLIEDFTFSFKPSANEIEMSISIERKTRVENGHDVKKACVLRLDVKISGKSEGNELLKINATIMGEFVCAEDMDNDSLKKVCLESGTMILLPVIRAAIMSFTGQAGLIPPIVIPLINPKITAEEVSQQ